MEPADLNSPANTNDDARLEALLRRAPPPLPDGGFSARVLAALPDAKAERTPWLRSALCFVGALAGCALALGRGGSWPELQASADQFASVFANAGPALANPWTGAALVIAGLSLLVAFWADLRDRLMS